MTDSKIEKWVRWAEETIKPEILTMYLHRETFNEVGRMAREANAPLSYFWEFLRDLYATTQAVAVRRQSEVSSRVVTFGRLLDEIAAESPRLTRDFFVGLWDDDDDRMANKVFDERFAGDAGDHLDPAIPTADLEKLRDTASRVARYVDQHLAHADARASAPPATFDELDAAVDLIGDLYTKYVLALTAAGYVTLVPVIQHNWKAIFTRPWIPPPPTADDIRAGRHLERRAGWPTSDD